MSITSRNHCLLKIPTWDAPLRSYCPRIKIDFKMGDNLATKKANNNRCTGYIIRILQKNIRNTTSVGKSWRKSTSSYWDVCSSSKSDFSGWISNALSLVVNEWPLENGNNWCVDRPMPATKPAWFFHVWVLKGLSCRTLISSFASQFLIYYGCRFPHGAFLSWGL